MGERAIHPHHREAMARIAERYGQDPRFEAVIIGGSVVKGLARPDSDIDAMLVAVPPEYQRRLAAHDLWVLDRDVTGYPGGYLDAKVIDRAFLVDVAERGSEPARWAFVDAVVVAARAPAVADLVARIPVYPEERRDANLRSFYAQLQLQVWFLREAERRNDSYLATRSAAQTVLFGGRLILAHNRMLFPFHKHFMAELRRAPDQPEGILALAETVLRERTHAAGTAFRDALNGWRDWGITWDEVVMQFMRDTEWTWREGWTPLDDR